MQTPQRWIYLSKNGTDEYVNRLAQGAGVDPTSTREWCYGDDPQAGIVLRGIMKHEIMKQCWRDKRPFRYVDTGYFGNRPSSANPHGWKWYHRIVPNNLQHGDIVPRPDDRWRELGLDIQPWRRNGRNIVVVMPDRKACSFYNTTPGEWSESVLAQLSLATDRPIQIRDRVADPTARTRNPATSFQSVLAGDTWAVVAFNSTAATEAVLAGVPAFVTAPCNAAAPVANRDLARIDDPWRPDSELVRAWACHLAYGQFHIAEMSSGRAQQILDSTT